MRTKIFLRFTEDQDFAEAPCGCLIQRSVDGQAHEFIMCATHRQSPKLWNMAKKMIAEAVGK